MTGEYIRNTYQAEKPFYVLSGRDTLIQACLCYGGHGAIMACANIAPVRMAFNLGSYPTILKESLELLGIDAGPCFASVGPMSIENKALLKKALIQAGVLA